MDLGVEKRRVRAAIGLAFGLILLSLFLWKMITESRNPVGPASVPAEDAPREGSADHAMAAPSRPGDLLLTNHGAATQSATDDAADVAELGRHFALRHRHLNQIYWATNEDWATLMVEGGKADPFLSKDLSLLSRTTAGDWVLQDRWGTPYHLHPQAQGKLGVRSAGPDRELFTRDDVVVD